MEDAAASREDAAHLTASAGDPTVYGRPEFANIDIGAVMRDGHPDISEGDDLIASLVERHGEQRGRSLGVIDVGAGSGVLSALLAKRLPQHRVIANDVEPILIEQARKRLGGLTNGEVFAHSFEDWREPLDIIISWGSHHHLANTYLCHARQLLAERNGILIIGDEFCPEYCTQADAERIAAASVIRVADGFVLTTQEEVAAYESEGVIPPWTTALERRRRDALWTWYKYVIDYAVAREVWPVALAELQIARDDLTTGFAGEHKLSPRIVERDLELNRFKQLSRHVIGAHEPRLQSFVVYECAVALDAER